MTINLVAQLADKIERRIASGDYPAGFRLKQEKLAEDFDVSRTPVREALQQLEARGIVAHHPRQGAVVRSPLPHEVREAYEIRAEMEGLAIELALEWMTRDHFSRMQNAQDRYTQAIKSYVPCSPGEVEMGLKSARRKPAEWISANDDFHNIILEACPNARLAAMVREMQHIYTRSVMISVSDIDKARMEENIEQHDAILQAMARRDAAEARRVLTHHIKRSGEIFARWIERRQDI